MSSQKYSIMGSKYSFIQHMLLSLLGAFIRYFPKPKLQRKQPRYKVKGDGRFYGLLRNGAVVLPCNNDWIWSLTPTLVGFRQGDYFGIYSALEARVIYAPELVAAIPFFKEQDACNRKRMTQARFKFKNKLFVETKAYMESHMGLLWQGDRLFVKGPSGVLVVYRWGEVREYQGENPALAAYKLDQLCLYEDTNKQVKKSQLKAFPFLTRVDEEIAGQRTFRALSPQNFRYSATSNPVKVKAALTESKWLETECKKFNYHAIPAGIKEKFLSHLSHYFKCSKNEWLVEVLIYITWCHANGYVRYDAQGYCTLHPLYALQPEIAERIRCVTTLYVTHELDALEYLLYLPSSINSYLEVLAQQN
ncbi:hypothetical protein ACSX1A_04050 [Pontibacter sp. MBLB2868]|uniref:hypothetical protein n=1 Tax=Pontibacter sp. MBLB2868 TaxID=3451555 RepID=UPI003F756CAE